LGSPGPFCIGGIDQQGHFVCQKTFFTGYRQQPIKGVALLLILHQACPKYTHTGCVETAVIQRQVQSNFPAQVIKDPLDCFTIRYIIIELQHQSTSHHRWSQARTSVVGAVHLFQIIIPQKFAGQAAHAPIERVR